MAPWEVLLEDLDDQQVIYLIRDTVSNTATLTATNQTIHVERKTLTISTININPHPDVYWRSSSSQQVRLRDLSSALPNFVDENGQNEPFTHFVWTGANNYWRRVTLAVFTEICAIVRDALPATILAFQGRCQAMDDSKWACLFDHLPQSLEELHFYRVATDLPLTLARLVRFPRLKQLTLFGLEPTNNHLRQGGRSNVEPLSLQCLEQFGNCLLNHLPQLKSVRFSNLCGERYIHLNHLVWCLSQMPRLEFVDVGNCFFILERPGSCRFRCMWEEEQLHQIRYGPRIQQAIREYDLREEGGIILNPLDNHNQLVAAMISVRDRIDCFHYFFSQIDPGLHRI